MENLDQNITDQNNNQYIPNSHYVEPDPVKKGKKKSGLIIFLIIILFLILGGGAYAYYRVSNVDLAKIMFNLEKVESVSFKVISDVGLVPKPQDKTLDEVDNYSLFDYSSILPTSTTWSKTNITGAVDISDDDNIKSWFNLYFLNDSNKKEYIIDCVTADKVNYFKINYLPAILSFDLSFISNRWISIDTSAGGEAGSISSIFNTITKMQEEIIEENQADIEVVKEEYKNLLLQNPILEIEKKFLPTYLNGDFVYHVTYKINEVNLRKVVEGYYEIENRLQEESFEESDLKDEFVIHFMEEYNKNMEERQKQKIENIVKYAKEISGEIWLGVVDLLPRKITFDFYSENEALYNELKVTGEVILSDYNKPVSITLPEESTKIDQIMTELLTKMFASSSLYGESLGISLDENLDQNTFDLGDDFSSISENGDVFLVGQEANLDTDKDGLSDFIEKELGTDINNPDTDGDGYSDNTEYTNGYNPLGK